jgi:hypothetical protein
MKRPKKRIAKDEIDFEKPINQEIFGRLIGLPQQTVSRLCQFDVLPKGATAAEWILCYTRFQMGGIYERGGWQALAKGSGDALGERENR